MNFVDWLRIQNSFIKMEVINRLTHHMSDNEILSVVDLLNNGINIVDAHEERGIYKKYTVDLFRIREIVTEKFPEQVIG